MCRRKNCFCICVLSIACFSILPAFAQAKHAIAATLKSGKGPYPVNNEHPGPAWFIDVAGQAGLRMENVNGGIDTKKYIIETTGSGVAILDYDKDGWPDIFLVNVTRWKRREKRASGRAVIFFITITMERSPM